jgi:trans-aconitate methyltransferase
MIHLASGTFPNEKYPNLEFIVMEATEINFNYQFDVIFSSAALHWVKDHRALLSGVSNCLKPGGRILFQMGGKENAKKIFRVSDEIIAKPKWIKYFNNFEFPVYFQADDVYGLMLIDAGIKPLRVEIISRDMAYKDKHGLAAWIRSTWMPFYQRVPDDFKEKFIYEIVDTYLLNNPPEPDGIVHVGMKRLEVEGEKG